MEFGRTPQNIEYNRRVFLIALYAVVGALILVPLGLLSVMHGRVLLGGVLLANAVICVGFMIYSRVTSRVRGVSYVFASQAGVLAIFLVMHGGVEGSGIYYAFPLALMMIMLGVTSLRSGMLISIAFMSLIALGLYAGHPAMQEYGDVHKSRIIIGLSALCMMSLISEWMRIKSYAAITNTAERLSNDANHDALTKLLNRRGLEEAVAHMGGTDFPAVIGVIDIDHFKKINDEFGHDAGDVALRCVAEYLRSNMKGRDLICRWGGEEFLVVFRHTSMKNANKVLTQICQEARSGTIRHGSNTFSITFSAGVAQLLHRSGFMACVAEADQLLYRAKEGGRDRIVSADLSQSEDD